MQLESTNNAAQVQRVAVPLNTAATSNATARRGMALPPFWFAALSMVAFLTLLLSFDHVVRQSVQNAELRRQNAAAQTTALWRCQALRDQQTRSGCLATIPGLGNALATSDTTTTTAYASF